MVLAAVAGGIDRGALGCQGDVGEARLLWPPATAGAPQQGGEQPPEDELRGSCAPWERNSWSVPLGFQGLVPLCCPQLRQKVTMDTAAGGFGGSRPSVGCSQDPSRAGGHIVAMSPQLGPDHPPSANPSSGELVLARQGGGSFPATAPPWGAGCYAGWAHGTGDPRQCAGRAGAAGFRGGSALPVLAA